MKIGTDDTQPADEKWWHQLTTLDTRLYIVYGAGIAASFSALFELAVKYGGWLKPFGIALPIVIDVYWMTALQVALDSSRSNRERGWAAVHAFFAISLSITGNIMYHELDKGTWRFNAHAQGQLVAVLACIPVVLTGTLTHLVLLARSRNEGGGAAVPSDGSRTGADANGSGEGTSNRSQGVVPRTAAAPVAAVPSDGSGSSAGGSGSAPKVAAETVVRRAVSDEKGSAPALRPAGGADADRIRKLRAEVTEDLKVRERPGLESAEQRERAVLSVLAEFRQRTGLRMNNRELAKALRMSKGAAGVLRDDLRGRELEQEESVA